MQEEAETRQVECRHAVAQSRSQETDVLATTRREADQLHVWQSWPKKLKPGGLPTSFAFRSHPQPGRLKNLQPGGKPTGFAFRSPGQPRRSKKLQPGGKPTVSEQAVHAPRRQQEKQRPDEKTSVRRLLQGTVRDLILLTMLVISPTIVVIFVPVH